MRGSCTPSSVLCSDPPDAYPVFTTSHCFSASDLDLVPPESCFTIPRGTFGDAAAVRCTTLLVAKVVCTDGTGRSFLFTTCRHLSAWNRNNLPLASSVSTARDAYAAADGVRGACTPSSVVYSDTPDTGVHNLPLHTCEEPVPNSVGIVCADHAGRLRSRCLSGLCEYLLPGSPSVPTP